jgi:hypothetical protein
MSSNPSVAGMRCLDHLLLGLSPQLFSQSIYISASNEGSNNCLDSNSDFVDKIYQLRDTLFFELVVVETGIHNNIVLELDVTAAEKPSTNKALIRIARSHAP